MACFDGSFIDSPLRERIEGEGMRYSPGMNVVRMRFTRTRRASRTIAALGLLSTVGGVGLGQPTQPATITVNSTADNTTAGDGQCTLREAIANVNSAADTTSGDCMAGTGTGDTVAFDLALPATIVLTTNTELEISRDVIIVGPVDRERRRTLAIDGNAHSTRVFDVTAGTVSITALTIQNGGRSCADRSCLGGAGLLVAADTTVTLSGCTFSGNVASGASGGGIFNSGTATLIDCELRGNAIGGDYWYFGGGAIENNGTMTLTACRLDDNSTGDEVGGAGIENTGTMTLTSCGLSGNSTGEDGDGAAIRNMGTMTVTNCVLNGNTAGQFASGGAIANEGGGIMTLNGCTLSTNSAAAGGAIANTGTMEVTNSTLSSNSTNDDDGGALVNSGIATLTNCTLTENSTSNREGGAISNRGIILLTNCTLTGNSTRDAGGAGIYNSPNGIATLTNTILEYNISHNYGCPASGCSENCVGGSFVDGGHNLSSDATCLPVDDPLLLADPGLAPLAYYGYSGHTQTMALCTGFGVPAPTCTGRSVAIDAGDDAVTGPPWNVATDQRGLPRRSGAHVDIGAFEVQVSSAPSCVGDCGGYGYLTVTQLLTMVRIALVDADVALCPAGDANGDGAITVDEILTAVGNALHGCPRPTPNGEYLCSAGPHNGQACDYDFDCAPSGACVSAQGVCDGGPDDGAYCDCAAGTCAAVQPSSDSTSAGTCQGGPNADESCEPITNCADAACVGTQMVCLGGDHKGLPCLRDTQCAGSRCAATGKRCVGGDFDESPCVDDADCSNTDGSPGGDCRSGSLGQACGNSGCLYHFCTDGVCCSTNGCPSPERCNVPGFEGTCSLPRCNRNTDCPEGSLCLYDSTRGFFACSAPTATATPSPLPTPTPAPVSPGDFCWKPSQCPAGFVCGSEQGCCTERICPQGESCRIAGHGGFCTVILTPPPPPPSARLCSGGSNDGGACGTDTDCPSGVCVVAQGVCDGGSGDGALCGCVSGTCVPTPPLCDPTLTGVCQDGANAGVCCDAAQNCPESVPCVGAWKVCLSGANGGVACLGDNQCPASACVATGRSCALGSRSGHTCVTDANCSDANGVHLGSCAQPTPTPTPTPVNPGDVCWETAQCPFGFQCGDEWVCCSQPSCRAGQSCRVPGHRGACTVVPPPTPTASSVFLCSGGYNDGHRCSSASDECYGGGVCVIAQGVCAGGPDDGKYCDCPAGSCTASLSMCDSPFAGTCQGGAKDTQCCQATSNCADGYPCIGTQRVCDSGSNKGVACLNGTVCGDWAYCASTGRICLGGAFDSYACVDDADCPKRGLCVGRVPPTPTATAFRSVTPIPGLTPQPLGHVCDWTAECAIGACTDGVCCSQSSCAAGEACNLPDSLGECAPVKSHR